MRFLSAMPFHRLRYSPRPFWLSFLFVGLLLELLGLLAAAPVLAANFTWNGSQGNDHWANSGNWTPGTGLPNDGTADVIFDGSVRLQPDMNGPWSINSLAFASTSGGFSVISSTGSTLTIGAGGITDNNLSVGETLSLAVNLSAAQTWNMNTGVTTFGGPVNNLGNLLTFNGTNTGFSSIFSSVISGTGGFTKTGVGTVAFVGISANTFTGPVSVNDGQLILSKTGPTTAFASSVLNIGDGIGAAGSATLLTGNDNLPFGNGVAVSIKADGIFISNTTTNDTFASLTMTGGTVLAGSSILIRNDVTTLASSTTATIAQNTIDMYFGGTHTLMVAQGTTPKGIDLDISSQFTTDSASAIIKAGPGTLRLSANNIPFYTAGLAVNAGTVLIGNDGALGAGTLTINGGTIQADGAPRVLNNPVNFAGTSTVGGAVNLTLNGAISGAGPLIKNGSSTLTLAGASTFTGPVTINGGTLIMTASLGGNMTNLASFIGNGGSLGGRLTNNGTATFSANFVAANGIENDAILSIPAGTTVTTSGSGLDNEGVLTMLGGALVLSGTHSNLNNGILTLNASMPFSLNGATLLNGGTFNLAGTVVSGAGTFTNSAGGTISGQGIISSAFSNSGAVVVLNATTTRITQAFSNNGIIQLGGTSASLAGGAITNAGTIQGQGNIANAITNNGTMEATDGTLAFWAAVINTGTLRAAIGTKLLMVGASTFPTNAALLSLTGGTFDNGGQALNNTGQISGFGTLATGGLTNNGAMTFTGGTAVINGPVTNNAAKTILIKTDPALFTGPVINNGSIKTTSTVATFAGGYSGSGTFISDPSVNIFQNDVTISVGGTMSGGVGDQFIFSGGAFANNGTFTNGGLLQSSDNASNAGSFTQSGPQSWSASTSFTNTGTATFSTNAGSLAARALTVTNNGGTVTFSASQNLAALNINAGLVTVAANGATHAVVALDLAALTITAGKLDLQDRDVIIRNVGGDPANAAAITALGNLIHAGLLGGSGVTSSVALTKGNTTLGFGYAADFNISTFDGVAVSPADMIIRYVGKGDANFDGKTDAADLNKEFSLLGGLFAGPYFGKGDLTGDGKVDAADLNQVFQDLGNLVGGELQPLADDGVAADSGIAPLPVPEPASLLILGMGVTTCMIQRRRKTDDVRAT